MSRARVPKDVATEIANYRRGLGLTQEEFGNQIFGPEFNSTRSANQKRLSLIEMGQVTSEKQLRKIYDSALDKDSLPKLAAYLQENCRVKERKYVSIEIVALEARDWSYAYVLRECLDQVVRHVEAKPDEQLLQTLGRLEQLAIEFQNT